MLAQHRSGAAEFAGLVREPPHRDIGLFKVHAETAEDGFSGGGVVHEEARETLPFFHERLEGEDVDAAFRESAKTSAQRAGLIFDGYRECFDLRHGTLLVCLRLCDYA